MLCVFVVFSFFVIDIALGDTASVYAQENAKIKAYVRVLILAYCIDIPH